MKRFRKQKLDCYSCRGETYNASSIVVVLPDGKQAKLKPPPGHLLLVAIGKDFVIDANKLKAVESNYQDFKRKTLENFFAARGVTLTGHDEEAYNKAFALLKEQEPNAFEQEEENHEG